MRFYLFLFLFFIGFVARTAPQLSPDAEIKLLTCGYGYEAYSMYGHSALRVVDTAAEVDVDVVFNYGMFSMANDNFILKFAKGETDYQLGIESYAGFLRGYRFEKRWVYSLDLNLSLAQKQALFDALEYNYRPENRVYRYSFFFDNCASRIRDLAETVLADSLQWQSAEKYVELPAEIAMRSEVSAYMNGEQKQTFREIIHRYQASVPWLNFLIDIPIAASADREMTFRETMFLPDFMMNAFQNARVVKNGQKVPLGINPQLVLNPETEPPVLAVYETPGFVMWGLFLLIVLLTVLGVLKNKRKIALDSFLFFVSGLIGLFLLFTSFVSVHPVMTPNYNLWWAFPLNLLFAVLIFIKPLQKPIYRFTTVWYLLFILAWAFLPQDINILFIGIAGSIAIRNAFFFIRK